MFPPKALRNMGDLLAHYPVDSLDALNERLASETSCRARVIPVTEPHGEKVPSTLDIHAHASVAGMAVSGLRMGSGVWRKHPSASVVPQVVKTFLGLHPKGFHGTLFLPGDFKGLADLKVWAEDHGATYREVTALSAKVLGVPVLLPAMAQRLRDDGVYGIQVMARATSGKDVISDKLHFPFHLDDLSAALTHVENKMLEVKSKESE